MWKKISLLALALLFVLLANMRLCCRAELDGQGFDALYSPQTIMQGQRAAVLAAEEICRDEAEVPTLRHRLCLRLRIPDGRADELSAALLDNTPGVMLANDVYVNGVALGSVSGEGELRERLDRFISGQKPSWAVSGFIHDPVIVKREYTRERALSSLDDMALLVSGMSPVLYYDDNGYICRA